MKTCSSCGDPADPGQKNCGNCRQAGRNAKFNCGKCGTETTVRQSCAVTFHVQTEVGAKTHTKLVVRYCVSCTKGVVDGVRPKATQQQEAIDKAVRECGDAIRKARRESRKKERQVAPEQQELPPAPFLKSPGGKWALAELLASLLPRDAKDRVYREPFLGGGAMYFWLRPARAVLSDVIQPLVDAYNLVKSDPEQVERVLQGLAKMHSEEHFYATREEFNALGKEGSHMGADLRRALLFMYLNKTCYNGLTRFSKEGEFNAPWGKFKKPGVVSKHMRAASKQLRETNTTVMRAGYEYLLDVAEKDDVIYVDSPYDKLEEGSFTSYSSDDFTRDDQARLATALRVLDQRGVLFVASNADTKFVRYLYSGFEIRRIQAPRSIGADASTRGSVSELVIRNVSRFPA